MARYLLCLFAVGALVAGGCGDEDTATDPLLQTAGTGYTSAYSGTPTTRSAAAYAHQRSGVSEACGSTATGDRPGCIYAAAYGGCYEGIEGEPIADGIRDFPQPRLEQEYRTGRQVCSP